MNNSNNNTNKNLHHSGNEYNTFVGDIPHDSNDENLQRMFRASQAPPQPSTHVQHAHHHHTSQHHNPQHHPQPHGVHMNHGGQQHPQPPSQHVQHPQHHHNSQQQHHNPHHTQQHGVHMSHVGPQHPQGPLQHSAHASQHSQPPPSAYHTTGAVQQQRHPHQPLHHQQQHSNHQHQHQHQQQQSQHHQQQQQHTHHQQSQQPHAMPTAHQLPHQPTHQMMMNQYHHQLYPHPFPGAPLGQAPFNTAGVVHRHDAANNLNSHQPTSINPNGMPQMNQMGPVISTVASGTTNVHQPGNNIPVIDHNMPPRIPLNHQPYMMQANYPFNVVYQPLSSQYAGTLPPNPPMMQSSRLPTDPGIRFSYDPKVSLSQTPIIGPKPTGPVTAAPPIKKRDRKPAVIKNPETGKQVNLDEYKKQSEPVKQEASKTLSDSSPPATLATQPSPAPDTSKAPTQTSDAPSTNVPAPATPNDPNDSLDLKMKNLTLESTPVTASSTRSSADDQVISSVIDHTPSITNDSPNKVPASTNGSSNLPDISRIKDSNSLEQVSRSNSSNLIASDQQDVAHNVSHKESTKESIPVDEPDRAVVNAGELVVETTNNTAIIGKSAIDGEINDETSVDSNDVEIDEQNGSKKSEKNQLDLPYQPGQYSPSNPSGKRRYTNEFLFAVYRMMRPELEQIQGNFTPNHSRVDFAPAYLNTPNFPNYRDQPTSRRASQQAVVRPRKVIATSSLQPEIELKTSENAWKPELEQEKSSAVESGEMDTKRLLKVFRGHLNKLTPQKYDSIIEKVAALDLDGPERLTSVIDLVFDKAVDEPGFCELYAKMCKVIGAKHEKFFFHLVKKCQEEFETSDLYYGLNVETRKVEIEKESDPLKKKMMSEELYEDMRLRRKKYLGTIKLIGEMYKFGLLIPKIIGLCMKQLIEGPSNENLECLCSLLATVGAKMACEEDRIIKEALNRTLKSLQEFAHSKKLEDHFVLESRIKFKILDTIDLSKKNWRPRMVENIPKKIEEIHEEAKEDNLRQQQQNHMNQNRNLMKNDDRDRHRRLGNNSYNNKNQSSGKWT